MLVQHTNIIVVTEMLTSCRVGRKIEPSLSADFLPVRLNLKEPPNDEMSDRGWSGLPE